MAYLSILTFLLLGLFSSSDAARFTIKNNCPYTVWAAASPGGGRRLDRGQTWQLAVPTGTNMGRIWGRTECNFDASGAGQCETGDCGILECKELGVPPNTLAEYAFNRSGDFYDISLVEGFNIPIQILPIKDLNYRCRKISCGSGIFWDCPGPLRVPGGCNDPCTRFKLPRFCCTDGPCEPTVYSSFFKYQCPNAYSYPQDDPSSSMFTCPTGTNYIVTFCPMGNSRFPALYNDGDKPETFVNDE